MKYVKEVGNSLMNSIVNGQSAYISYLDKVTIYSSIICRKFENVKLKIASKRFFITEYGMAFRKGFDQDFKQKINKL